MSIGEKVVATIMEQMKIYYFYDIQIYDLKGVKNGFLKFDFLIPRDQNDIDLNNVIAIEYNGIIIPKVRYKKKYLKDKDRVEVVHFIGGG